MEKMDGNKKSKLQQKRIKQLLNNKPVLSRLKQILESKTMMELHREEEL